MPADTPATLKRAATNFAAWWTEAQWVWTVCLRLLPDSVVTAIWTRAFCAWVQHANHSAAEPPYLHILSSKCLRVRVSFSSSVLANQTANDLSEPSNRIWDHWTSVFPTRGTRQPLKNTRVRLWTRLCSRRVCYEERETEYWPIGQ